MSPNNLNSIINSYKREILRLESLLSDKSKDLSQYYATKQAILKRVILDLTQNEPMSEPKFSKFLRG